MTEEEKQIDVENQTPHAESHARNAVGQAYVQMLRAVSKA